MTLTDLQNEVYIITGRPDLVNETLSGIRSATLKAHQSDYYWKDLYEVGVQFDTAAFQQQLDYRSIIPNWRSLKYMRKWTNPANVTVGPGGDYLTTGTTSDPNSWFDGNNLNMRRELEIVLPENVFDDYNLIKKNICYVAGAYININSATSEQYYLLGCYVNPNITVSGYSSWVALDHPYYIIFDAAGAVFKAIGKDDEAAMYRKIGEEQLAMLKTSNILAEGF